MASSLRPSSPELSDSSSSVPDQESYDCPVCLESLLPPVYQCHNGHLVCNECVHRMQKCPTCRDDLPSKKIRNLIVEKLARGLTYECKNKNSGCRKVLKYEELEYHLLDCPFMPHPFCEYLGIENCDKKYCTRDIIDHLTKDHQVTGYKPSRLSSSLANDDDDADNKCDEGDDRRRRPKLSSVSLEFYQKVMLTELSIANRTIAWMPTYCNLGSKLFFVKTKLDLKKKTIAWMISVTGSDSTAQDFRATIRLTSSLTNDEYLEWSGRVFDLKTHFSSIRTTYFNLPIQTLENYGGRQAGGQELRWKISLTIQPKNLSSSTSSSVQEQISSLKLTNLIELTPLYKSIPEFVEPAPLVVVTHHTEANNNSHTNHSSTNVYHQTLRRIVGSQNGGTLFRERIPSRPRPRPPSFGTMDTLW